MRKFLFASTCAALLAGGFATAQEAAVDGPAVDSTTPTGAVDSPAVDSATQSGAVDSPPSATSPAVAAPKPEKKKKQQEAKRVPARAADVDDPPGSLYQIQGNRESMGYREADHAPTVALSHAHLIDRFPERKTITRPKNGN